MKLKIAITIICLAILAGLLMFFSDQVFLLAIRFIPSINVTTAYWIPLVMSLLLATLGLIILRKQITSLLQKIIAIISFIVIGSVSFYSNPMYPEDFENRINSLPINEETSELYLNGTDASITCYFLVTCPFCEIASDKFNALYQAEKIKDIEFVYYAYQSTADSLVETNNITIPYSVIDDEDSFFLRAGTTFPSVQFSDGKNIHYWAGNNVNFGCFDFLIEQSHH